MCTLVVHAKPFWYLQPGRERVCICTHNKEFLQIGKSRLSMSSSKETQAERMTDKVQQEDGELDLTVEMVY